MRPSPSTRGAWLAVALALCALGAGCRSAADLRAPLGEETTLVFEGARSLPEDDLRAAILADRYGPAPRRATRSQVDDAAYAVEERYRQSGYAEASVDYAFEQTDEGVTARLVVQEGLRLELVQVSFEGNANLDDEVLQLFFLPEEEPRPFVRSEVRSARSGIEEYYYQRGWLRARVVAVEEHVDATRGRVRLVCRVVEGPRFLLEAAELVFAEGAEALPGVERALDKARAERLDRGYTPSVAYGLRAALLQACGTLGHPDARVEFESTLDEESGAVRLSYTVDPGPLVRVAEVRIEGADPGHEKLVRTRLELGTGDAWNETKARQSFANLYRSGYFRTVQIQLAPGPSEARDLVVSVEELPSLEFFLQPGYGSYEGPRLTLGFDERNVLGTGTGLSGETTVGVLAQGATLAWNDPWIDRGRYATRVAVSADHREEPSFTQTVVGTELSLTRVWNDKLRSTLSYAFRRNTLDNVDLDTTDPLVEDALEDVNVASFALSTTHDDRSDLFIPMGGGRERASVQWASTGFGSEIDFVGINLEVARFFELSKDTVLAARLLSGIKKPVAATDALPLQERFFNGGENTVRSFAEDELGPADSGGNPTGGEGLSVFNLELRQSLIGSLQAGLFFDAGNVSEQAEDFLSFDDVRTGIGAGLRYLLPIGPIRLDVGWNPAARTGEDDFVVHLAIGMAF